MTDAESMSAPWPDDLADCLALVEAIRSSRVDDVAVVLRHTVPLATLVTACKLLAVLADEHQATPDQLRIWSAQAVRQL